MSETCPLCPQWPPWRIWQSIGSLLPLPTRYESVLRLFIWVRPHACQPSYCLLYYYGEVTSPASVTLPGAYPPPIAGGVPPPWPPMMDNSKPWDYYSRRDDKRDKERERPRERPHERDRERERDHSPTGAGYNRSETGTHEDPQHPKWWPFHFNWVAHQVHNPRSQVHYFEMLPS